MCSFCPEGVVLVALICAVNIAFQNDMKCWHNCVRMWLTENVCCVEARRKILPLHSKVSHSVKVITLNLILTIKHNLKSFAKLKKIQKILDIGHPTHPHIKKCNPITDVDNTQIIMTRPYLAPTFNNVVPYIKMHQYTTPKYQYAY